MANEQSEPQTGPLLSVESFATEIVVKISDTLIIWSAFCWVR